MFVLGLLVGPVIGLLVGGGLVRGSALDRRLSKVVIILIFLAILFTGALKMELRVGLLSGMVVGLLLSLTPAEMSTGVKGRSRSIE